MSRAPVVAVTGATGFLGLHLVTALAREGVQLRLLARRDTDPPLWRDQSLDVVRGSLEQPEALERLVTGADAIVHVAGLIKARSHADFMRTNRDGTATIARIARRRAPASRFIAISSQAAREAQLSDYAASKHAGEEAAREAYGDAPKQLVIVRPPAIYGPWDRETLTIFKAASHAIAPVFGSGRAAIIHVSDAAAAIARLAIGVGEAGIYTLSDPNPAGYSMAELISEAGRAVGHRPRLVRIPDSVVLGAGRLSALWGRLLGDAPIFTMGKAREMLHPDWSVAPEDALPPTVYQSKIAISEGFRDTATWYKAAGWLR